MVNGYEELGGEGQLMPGKQVEAAEIRTSER